MIFRDHAIVVGGSVAGLLAARVLADRFRRVTILDRDSFPSIGEQRRGVPQGVHTHGLLAGGRREMERLLPGLSADLFAAGAFSGDALGNSRWFVEGACLRRSVSGIHGVLVSRPLLEGMIRRRVLAIPNISAVENCVAESLVASGDRVCAVRAGDRVFEADLIVDASGRGSHAPQWLEQMGFEKPAEERVEVGLSYVTRWFRRRPDHLNGDVGVVIPPTPLGKRAAGVLAQEGGRWTVTLIGYFGVHAPIDLAGFIEFARTLPAPFVYDLVRDAEPLDEGFSARFASSIRRRYERVSRFPRGFLVIGDALCSFNPMYAQGMSVAALEAGLLETERLTRDFFRRAARIIDVPWSIAVGGDLRIPETRGARTFSMRAANWYVSQLHRAGHRDPVPAIAFLKLSNLLAPPPSILHPRVAWRVIRANLF